MHGSVGGAKAPTQSVRPSSRKKKGPAISVARMIINPETSADSSGGLRGLSRARGRGRWTNDLRTMRVLRFALGVTTAIAIAFAYEWPLSFLTPVFVAVFVALPLPAPSLEQALSVLDRFFFRADETSELQKE